MSDREERLEGILSSVADGTPVSWEQVMEESDPGVRNRVEALGAVSRIAEFNRRLQREGAPPLGREETGEARRWGDLILLERISGSDRTEVFRAWDPGLHREVALKLISEASSAEDPRVAALLREGRAVARVRHANVVSVHGIDDREGRIGFWMELLRGKTLEADVREKGAMSPDRVVRLGIDLGSALAAVHEAGILHRDVKPANISCDGMDRYVLTDFGLGWEADRSWAGAGPSGTPMYMAPELFTGEAPSERSDVYALGLTLWFALTGRHPFEAESLARLMEQVQQGPLNLKQGVPGVPPDITALIRRATAREPGDRYPDAAGFVAALEAWRETRSRPESASRLLRPAVGVLVVLAVAATGWWMSARTGRSAALRPPEFPASMPAASSPPVAAYDIDAAFLKHGSRGIVFLEEGDRVAPGDRLSLRLRASRDAWVYVLNEDEAGERFLLFPQPGFDVQNPVIADSTWILPGPIAGRSFAWNVTSAGGREHLLVAVSPEPVPELEAALRTLEPAEAGRAVSYAPLGRDAMEPLRGVGGMVPLPPDAPGPDSGALLFHRFRALSGPETTVQGVWVRRFSLENTGAATAPR